MPELPEVQITVEDLERAGIRGRTLIINLSGSPKAVREQFAVIAQVLPHALEQLRAGKDGVHYARAGEHRRQV